MDNALLCSRDYADLEKERIDHDTRLIDEFLDGSFPPILTVYKHHSHIEFLRYTKGMGYARALSLAGTMPDTSQITQKEKESLYSLLLEALYLHNTEHLTYLIVITPKYIITDKAWVNVKFRQVMDVLDPKNDSIPFSAQDCYHMPRLIEYLHCLLNRCAYGTSEKRTCLNMVHTALKRAECEPHFYSHVMIPYQQKLLEEKAKQHNVPFEE